MVQAQAQAQESGFDIRFYEYDELREYPALISTELYHLFKTGMTVGKLITKLLTNESGKTNIRIKCYDKLKCDFLPRDYDRDTKGACDFFFCNQTRTFCLMYEIIIINGFINNISSYNTILDRPCDTLVRPDTGKMEIDIRRVTKRIVYRTDININVLHKSHKTTVNIGDDATIYDLRQKIINEIDAMKDKRLCDFILIYQGWQIDDLTCVFDHNVCTILTLVMEESCEERVIDLTEANYCSKYLIARESELKTYARYAKFKYIKDDKEQFINLLFHRYCDVDRIKQTIEIETNEKYFSENPNIVLDSVMLKMISNDAITRYRIK